MAIPFLLSFFEAKAATAIPTAMNRAIMLVAGNSGTLGVEVTEDVGVFEANVLEVGLFEDATAVTELAVS